jgi:hypothetical protein
MDQNNNFYYLKKLFIILKMKLSKYYNVGRCDNDDCSPRWCIVVFMAGGGLWYCIFLVKRDIVFLFSKNN